MQFCACTNVCVCMHETVLANAPECKCMCASKNVRVSLRSSVSASEFECV